MRIQAIREKRNKIITEMRAITGNAETRGRDITDDEQKKFDKLKGKLSKTDKELENATVIADAERAMPAVNRRGNDGSFSDQVRRFSLLKAVGHAIDSSIDAGLELEVSAELATRAGRNPSGIFVPHGALETRDILTSGSGANLIPETHRAEDYIDVLRPKLRVAQLGATVLPDLVGEVDIPRMTAGAGTSWVAEHSAVSEQTPTFDTVQMSPKTVGAYTEISRRMVINANPGIEQIVRADLANALANEIDAKAIAGDGTSNTPTGVLNVSGRSTQSLATLSWENILAFISAVETSDALVGMEMVTAALSPGESMSTPMGWLTNGHAVKKLRSTIKIVNSEFIQPFANELAGYRLLTSSNVPGNPNVSPVVDGSIIFGNWSDLLVGYWSAVDILVNPYHTDVFAKGGVLISALQDVDVAVRHAESFCTTNDIPL